MTARADHVQHCMLVLQRCMQRCRWPCSACSVLLLSPTSQSCLSLPDLSASENAERELLKVADSLHAD